MPDGYDELNPQVHEVTIGITSLRKVKIYPLSMHDQFELTDIITQGVTVYVENVGEDVGLNPETVGALISLIRSNIEKVLAIITGEKAAEVKKIIKELTNAQLAHIVKIVYEVNYEEPVKNVTSLFDNLKETEDMSLTSERPSPQSARSMDTDSNTSQEGAT